MASRIQNTVLKKFPPDIHIRLRGLRKEYGGTAVFDGLHLDIRRGEFVAIVGRSGCGKSTLLRLLSGLEKPEGGEINVSGRPLEGYNREACMMFQDGRLLPWKRVLDNVMLGLKSGRTDEAKRALASVGLEDRLDAWPSQLSGGQKQRVALARALIHKPSLLLLDEPLGALDALTRLEMQALIERLWIAGRFTALLVTHDVEEAAALADRVIVLREGGAAEDIPVPIPRPRARGQSAFAELTGRILGRILERKDSGEPLPGELSSAGSGGPPPGQPGWVNA